MLLVNFSHPLTSAQHARLEALLGGPLERVIDVRTHFDPAQPFADQATALVEGVGLTSSEWQGTPLVVNPPSLNAIACLVLAELHGRMGYFPSMVRLRPLPAATPPAFEVAEVVNLQRTRDEARARR